MRSDFCLKRQDFKSERLNTVWISFSDIELDSAWDFVWIADFEFFYYSFGNLARNDGAKHEHLLLNEKHIGVYEISYVLFTPHASYHHLLFKNRLKIICVDSRYATLAQQFIEDTLRLVIISSVYDVNR